MTERIKKYTHPILSRFPDEVFEAMRKRVGHKKAKYGKYCDADLIRTAVVNHLKNKGYLQKGKDYL